MNRPAEIEFAKLSAAGNRYVAVDARGLDLDWSEVSRQISDEEVGVGSDGMVLITDCSDGTYRMCVMNSDGSEAEMSGNGLRLFAKFLIDSQRVEAAERELLIETGAGPRTIFPTIEEDKMVSGRVNMGTPSFQPEDLPCTADPGEMLSLRIPLSRNTVEATCLSVGNPHAVLILDESVDDFALEEIGTEIQNHRLFPNRVNVEIVNVLSRSLIRPRIFERGEGETLSSGTGSTASAVACRVHQLIDDEVTVRCKGGDLAVRWPGEGDAFLGGPTTEIGAGVWSLERREARWTRGGSGA